MSARATRAATTSSRLRVSEESEDCPGPTSAASRAIVVPSTPCAPKRRPPAARITSVASPVPIRMSRRVRPGRRGEVGMSVTG